MQHDTAKKKTTAKLFHKLYLVVHVAFSSSCIMKSLVYNTVCATRVITIHHLETNDVCTKLMAIIGVAIAV